jgi:hypothetical protein
MKLEMETFIDLDDPEYNTTIECCNGITSERKKPLGSVSYRFQLMR